MAAKTGTYTLIASNTLGSATGTVTFSSIPGNYTDLIVSIAIAGLSAQETPRMYCNGDTSALYSTTYLYGNGTTAASNRYTAQSSMYGIGAINAGNSTGVSNILINLLDYSNTTTFKTVLARNSSAATSVDAAVNLYRSTNAITSLTFIVHGSNTYSAGTTFKLYGIEAGNL